VVHAASCRRLGRSGPSTTRSPVRRELPTGEGGGVRGG
jgi:hypothetical protein